MRLSSIHQRFTAGRRQITRKFQGLDPSDIEDGGFAELPRGSPKIATVRLAVSDVLDAAFAKGRDGAEAIDCGVTKIRELDSSDDSGLSYGRLLIGKQINANPNIRRRSEFLKAIARRIGYGELWYQQNGPYGPFNEETALSSMVDGTVIDTQGDPVLGKARDLLTWSTPLMHLGIMRVSEAYYSKEPLPFEDDLIVRSRLNPKLTPPHALSYAVDLGVRLAAGHAMVLAHKNKHWAYGLFRDLDERFVDPDWVLA